jgi:uncharacterized RDD family membrane protein YckC
MQTGLDILSSNHELRVHWLKRIVAVIVDLAIVTTPITLALVMKGSIDDPYLVGLVSGAGLFIYSLLLEGLFGRTWGKRIMGLRVVSLGEKGSLLQATIRSVPKFFWYIFLPIDTLAGLATQGDPRQRWSDKVSETTVVALRLPHKDHKPRSMQRTSETSTK